MEGMGKTNRVKQNKLKNNVLAISNESGGAEALSSYLRHRGKEHSRFRCVVQGFAKKIYISKGLGKYLIDAKKGRELILKGQVDLLLTSTGRSSDLSTNFIALAKSHSIKTVTILEHWLGYKERFGYPSRDWRSNLPDEIWVVDKLARKIAEKEFGKAARIKIKPNFYFKDLRAEYSKSSASKDRRYFNVLFLNQPILKKIASKKKKIKITEIGKVTKLINFMKTMNCSRPIRFTIRQHPIESRSGFAEVVKGNTDCSNFRVVLSDPSRNSLVEDVKSADVVIGIQSSALTIASLFKKTICCCDKPPLWLSAYNVKHIRPNLSGLEHFIYGRRK